VALDTPLWIQQGQFSSQLDRLLISTIMRPGIPDNPDDPNPVLPTVNDLRCTPNPGRLAIDVAAGTVVIAGTDQVRQGNYVCRSTAVESIDLDPRPASGQSRRDLIYAQVQDSSAGVEGIDGWLISRVTGVPTGATPIVPAVPPSGFALANVLVTASGGATVTQGEITDTRRRSTTSVRERQTGIVSAVASIGTSGSVGNTPLAIPGMQCSFTALAGRSYVCKLRALIQRQSNAGQMVASWPVPAGITVLPSGGQILEYWTASLAVNALNSIHWEWAFTCDASIHGQTVTLQLSLSASGAGGTGRIGNGDARWASQTWVELI
jgi:hypothetical protein